MQNIDVNKFNSIFDTNQIENLELSKKNLETFIKTKEKSLESTTSSSGSASENKKGGFTLPVIPTTNDPRTNTTRIVKQKTKRQPATNDKRKKPIDKLSEITVNNTNNTETASLDIYELIIKDLPANLTDKQLKKSIEEHEKYLLYINDPLQIPMIIRLYRKR